MVDFKYIFQQSCDTIPLSVKAMPKYQKP